MFVFVKRHRIMILVSVLSFYLGCAITLNMLRVDCADAVSSVEKKKPSLHKIEYAVLVLSSPGNEFKRDTIRTTWASLTHNIIVENGEVLYRWNNSVNKFSMQHEFIKLYFVIGTQGLNDVKLTKLNNENNRSKDVLLLDNLEDSYKNLAQKMLQALKWFSENLKGLKYLIKCDDDSFVRIDLIIKDLEVFAPNMNAPEIGEYVSYKDTLEPARQYKGLYWGYFDGRAKVYLNGKWQEKNWFLCDNYLPYALGGGYVISRSIVDYVARNAEFLSCYNSEDVSMGVWTASLDGINRVHDIRFDTEWKSRGCNKVMLVRHKQDTSDMFQMYRSLVQTQGGKLCRIETTERKSYLYKWNVLPSLCCR